jgi:UDP-GlcNAc:undecaprenyl-phosphate GlcNAc-1-phosphate transferase
MATYLASFSVISAVVSIMLLSRLAMFIGLVDVPDSRKSHVGHIPVIGGLAIVVSMFITLLMFNFNWPFNKTLTMLALVLFLSGLIDDKIALTPKFRITVQIVVALLTVFVGDLHLYYFGDIFGFDDFYLGFWGEVLSILAIVTAINAFNMIDGIDGLLAMLLINVFVTMAIVDQSLTAFYLVCLCQLLVFVLFNLGIASSKDGCRKIFMGDAGSMLFGYFVVCLLIDKSQHPGIEIRPVTVLWIIAVPLMDLVAIVIRRSRKKQPIMKADRGHLHHIFIRMGFSDRQALVIIVAIAVFFSTVGLLSEHYQVPEALMFYGFLSIFAFYLYFILHAWRFVTMVNWFKARKGATDVKDNA